MWRRLYLLLVFIRLFLALCPSYLHPDENFQGPEVIAGRVFSWPVKETWEFNPDAPIRSAFSLWPVFGIPMLLFRWVMESSGAVEGRPSILFWALRLVMFSLSFILEDWAVYELVDSPRHFREAILLVASSYVTCTWQMHTFSNSVETLIILWSLVLVKRIREHKSNHSTHLAFAVLAYLLVLGTFNRITFPAFMLVPCLYLIPIMFRRPTNLIGFALCAASTVAAAILVDTDFYSPKTLNWTTALAKPVITPINNLLYNTESTNLAKHGTHPFYQHALVNFPQLIGPALIPLILVQQWSLPLISVVSGILLLSFIPHQEARFLIPAVPLALSSIRLPHRYRNLFLTAWILFNLALGSLMGIYHQAGIVPAQIWIEREGHTGSGIQDARVYWWKTYSPPTWLLGEKIAQIDTVDLMGLPAHDLQSQVCRAEAPHKDKLFLVAPLSASYLDQFNESSHGQMRLTEAWRTSKHLNLDDMEFGDDGIIPTLQRVVGRRGLAVWKVTCPLSFQIGMDW